MKMTARLLNICMMGAMATALISHTVLAEDLKDLKRVTQKLVAPPFLPEHEQKVSSEPKVVQVRLEIQEKKIVIDEEGTEIWAFTYNGSVPGPMIVAHQGDYVELTLVNPASSSMDHNIDFHAATGAMGGGELTMVAPGEEVVLRFKATKAGVFVYHCAPGGVMIPWHVAHGMNGAIMILPREGLKDNKGRSLKYDRAYYIGEQDFYIPKNKKGKFKKYGSPAESMADDQAVMLTNNPTHVVFNGKVGALTGAGALKAKVGETVLILHSQSNRDSRPHLIGGHGDFVWERGSFNDVPQTDLETWFIAGGSAGAATYKFLQPGTYAYLNHNLIDAVMKGAAAHFKIEGQWNNDLMEQVVKPAAIKAGK